MASSWTCADGHVHETDKSLSSGPDSLSVNGLGKECKTSGDKITGETYASGATAAQVLKEWTASTRATAVAS